MERMMLSENLCYFLWDLKNHSQKGIITTSDNHATILQYTNFALSVLTIIIGLVGNTIVIYVSGFMMKEKRSKVWFLNLAVADFIFLLFLPLSAVSLLKNNWPFGSHLCKAYHFFSNVNMYASIFIIVALNIERVLSVAKPIWHLKFLSPRVCYLTCALIWTIAVLSSLPVMVSSDEYKVGNGKQCLLGYIGKNNNVHNISEQNNQKQVITFVKELFFKNKVREKRNVQDNNTTEYSDLPTNTTLDCFKHNYIEPMSSTNTIVTTETFKALSINIIFTLAQENLEILPETREQCEANECCANEEEVTKYTQMLYFTERLVIPLIVIGFFIPLLVILFSNILIVMNVRKSQTMKSSRLYRIVVTVVLVYFLTWTPLVTAQLISLSAARNMNFPLLFKVNMILPLLASIAYSNTCLNPIVYVLRHCNQSPWSLASDPPDGNGAGSKAQDATTTPSRAHYIHNGAERKGTIPATHRVSARQNPELE
ncbi:chemerin-like receptor 1 [Discoglossus pictus]